MKTFYRVQSLYGDNGLWYLPNGEFIGSIHNSLSFCGASSLEMPFDESIVGYISAVDDIDDLWKWFTKEEVKKLQDNFFFINQFESDDYKWYDKFNHWVINQETSILTKQIRI